MGTGSSPFISAVSGDQVVNKIIASGTANVVPRAGSLTLTSTNIGYRFEVIITGITLPTKILTSNITLKANFTNNKMDINSSGIFYNDGTNKVSYSYYYYLNIFDGTLHIFFNMRATDGSYTFNPTDYFTKGIYWEISDLVTINLSGSGALGIGDGKYFYYDLVSYDTSGTVSVALASSLIEFINGHYAYFPNPLYVYP